MAFLLSTHEPPPFGMKNLRARGAQYTHTPARFLFLAGGRLRLKRGYLTDDHACFDHRSAASVRSGRRVIVAITGASVVQLTEELLYGGLRRSAPCASPEADVVPHVASKKDAGDHQRLDKIELGTRVLGIVMEEGELSMVNDRGVACLFRAWLQVAETGAIHEHASKREDKFIYVFCNESDDRGNESKHRSHRNLSLKSERRSSSYYD